MAKIFLSSTSTSICSNCKEYLSVAPVIIVSTEPICGRCSKHYSDGTRADFYENLAKYIAFPCINDKYGCDAKCAWGSVELHEKKCQFIPISCPSLTCTELISKYDLIDHFKTKHRNLILQDDEVFSVTRTDGNQSNDINILFLWRNQAFILKIRYYKTACFCGLSNIDETLTGIIKYELIVQDIDKNHLFKMPEATVCEYKTKTFISQLTKVDVTGLQLSEVVCSILIKENKPTVDPWSDKILSESECPICYTPMRPPIHSCKLGHSICHECLSTIQECPICKQTVNTNFRNYPLEKILNLINYPCKNKNMGCTYRGKLSDIIIHEKTCTTERCRCFLLLKIGCNWEGSRDHLVSHITSSHSAYFVRSGDIIWINTGSSNNSCDYFTSYEENVFRIFIRYVQDDGIYLMCKLLRLTENKQLTEKYYCYFTFSDNKDTILTANRSCLVANPDDSDMQNCLYLKSSSILPFIQSKLKIEINLLKI